MRIEFVPTLADAIKEYLTVPELAELSELFDISVEYGSLYPPSNPAYMKLAKMLITQVEQGNNRRFLETIVPALLTRCHERVAHTAYERKDYHEDMEGQIGKLKAELGGQGIPSEVTVAEDHPFTAKSEVRELLGQSETQVTIVDNYVGPGTLDCLRDVQHPIRLLTGAQPNSIGQGFDQSLKDFRSEGFIIDVRRHSKLHDRYILFNDRCWLSGSSLKDAGKKTFSIIECIDSKVAIVSHVEKKWQGAVVHSV